MLRGGKVMGSGGYQLGGGGIQHLTVVVLCSTLPTPSEAPGRKKGYEHAPPPREEIFISVKGRPSQGQVSQAGWGVIYCQSQPGEGGLLPNNARTQERTQENIREHSILTAEKKKKCMEPLKKTPRKSCRKHTSNTLARACAEGI